MARNDIKIYDPIEPRYSTTPIVASGAVQSINSGEPTKFSSAGAVVVMVDGDGTTADRFAGIAKSDSTDTVAVAGNVTLWIPMPGMIYSGRSKDSTAADTQAEIDALYGKRVVFDVTASVFTVDTAASDSATNGLVILGGDYHTSEIYFAISTICNILH